MIDETRLESLIQRKLDGELSDSERVELAEAIANDPTACRRHDEFVALEGLLFAVGRSDRPALEPDLSPFADDGAVPDEEEFLGSAVGLSTIFGALALAAILWIGSMWVPPSPTAPPVREIAALEVCSLSDGFLAVPGESANPDIQIVWIYSLQQPAEGNVR